ncbi:hypothetical protein L1887_15987 [Cichorium endivia]|nr:hypothetical protein L1887_15987 [Cichorium endivia]
MVGGTHQQPQASQLAPPPSSSSTAPVATTEEEEFLKRNTDCVYFLASPLTCKKGSECEYRHSDIARVNPRDCWYWLNGNCLNPKCGFRHPPLDGLLGAEVPPSVGPTLPQAPVTPSPHGTPYTKQGVACIFFQKGFCLKGHLCPFLHGPPNKPVPPVPSNNVTKPSIQEQKLVQQETVQKPVEFLPPKIKQNPVRNGGGGGGGFMEKKVAAPPVDEPRYKPGNVVSPNEFMVNRSNHGVYEPHHVSDTEGINGKDVDEYSREPTPGFDVLVDNELGDSEYYPNEEQFGRSRGHEFDFDVDQEMYNEQREEGYAWEDHRESSERILGGAHNFGRKRYPRDESPDHFDKSDLRHRISNQRRGSFGNNNVGGGLRSVISREHPRDNVMARRDRHHDRHHDCHRMDTGSLSSRLRGRIKMPGGNENDSRVEREIDMGRRNRSRYSPRPPHGRIRDRINEGRDYRGPRNDNEYTKRSQKDDGQPLGKRKFGQQSEDNNNNNNNNLSFEGPKPLSEILKRKRGGSVNEDNNNNGNNENEKKEVIEARSVVDDVKNEESGLNDEDALLDEELEGYDHKDGDYDYEAIDGEEYNLEEGEEYMEEEEEGGKKESEVYS